MHSNSERSLNSPVMSGHSMSGSGLSSGVVGNNGSGSGGRSKSQLHGRPPSLVDVVSSTGGSGGRPVSMADEQVLHRRHQQQQHHLGQGGGGNDDDDTGSSTSSDESGNDSFTCSEIEYDNNSVSGEKLSDVIFNKSGGGKSASGSSDRDSQRRRRLPLPLPSPPPLPPAMSPIAIVDALQAKQAAQQQQLQDRRREQEQAAGYDTFDSSFRGSLSTLVASDDDGPMYRGNVRTPNNASESSSIPVGLGWDYLLSWAPSNNGMRPMMQLPPPPSPPRYGDHDHDLGTGGSGGAYHHHHRHRQSVTPRMGDGSSRSSSRQSPKSPEEYV